MESDKRSYKKLVSDDDQGMYYVLISHKELDSLIGRLMQIFDLNGDIEQRNALKSETKQRCREWLDNEYQDAGYDKWRGWEGASSIYRLEAFDPNRQVNEAKSKH